LIVFRGHEQVEFLLEQIGLPEIPVESEHAFDGVHALRRKALHMCKKQLSGTLEIAALLGQELFLNPFADILQGPGTVANHVEAVNDDGGGWEKPLGQRNILFLHIGNEIANILPIREGREIAIDIPFFESREDVQNLLL